MILYLKDRIVKWSLIFSIILNILLWVLFYFRIPVQVEPIALRYSIYVGINLIGPWHRVFWFAIIGILIGVLNFILAKKIFNKNKLLAHFLVITALLCQMILLIYGVIIVMVNL